MKIPFVYGKLALFSDFTDRETELERLVNNFKSGVNTMLISPRRWGKSSLVVKAADRVIAKNKKVKVCFIDVFEVRTEAQFYQVLAEAVMKVTTSRIDEIGGYLQRFMSKLLPKISFSPDNMQEICLAFDWKDLQKHPSEVLDLAEKMAIEKKIEIVLCFDEFQNIAAFEHPLAFQKKLRSHWQKHQKVSYCLYGSKRHMMMDIFTSPSMPFYKFGDVFFLEKIKEDKWVPFIQSKFLESKKKIHEKDARLIAQLVENHPYYVQQLAQLTWLRTINTCKSPSIHDAHDTLMLQLSLLFQNITDSLSIMQVHFLKALVNGETRLSSKKILDTYDLGSSANISQLKKALANREIIDIVTNEVNFTDPVYKAWLKKYYFKIK
ncbi:ATP-binding protein [Lentimicrobium sp. L6]|uniref:AAA family ATPase n=1 Tax=Lentimicrobium sp. L6 TaxID=2735916 RepID=UPI001553D610|nr:ATP-binding protein [Lentimicrobium sp. L6]NPD83413.1 ATP-binding protein [Lentimicrobium sp. L6]